MPSVLQRWGGEQEAREGYPAVFEENCTVTMPCGDTSQKQLKEEVVHSVLVWSV